MEKRKVEVIPHNPTWKEEFAQESEKLKNIFGDELVRIHHIGSTSIPEMSAKPIIDILIEVTDIERVDILNSAMIEAGYEPKGENGIPGRRYFQKESNGERTHHVHVFQKDNPETQRHLKFRDYLISHPEEASEYKELKEGLAKEYPEDIESYIQGKNQFIQEIDEKASKWED